MSTWNMPKIDVRRDPAKLATDNPIRTLSPVIVPPPPGAAAVGASIKLEYADERW
jgi:hypothetical protein